MNGSFCPLLIPKEGVVFVFLLKNTKTWADVTRVYAIKSMIRA